MKVSAIAICLCLGIVIDAASVNQGLRARPRKVPKLLNFGH